MDVIGQNGLLHMRIVDGMIGCLISRLLFMRARFRPEKCFLAHHGLNQSLRFQNLRHLSAAACKDYPDELLHAHGMVWLRVLAYLVLNRQEREVWWKLQGSKTAALNGYWLGLRLKMQYA